MWVGEFGEWAGLFCLYDSNGLVCGVVVGI